MSNFSSFAASSEQSAPLKPYYHFFESGDRAVSANPSQPSPVVNIDAHTFQTEVLDASHHTPVLVDFWAEWCAPCKALGPMLDKVVMESDGAVRLAKIDIDSNQEFAGSNGIRSIPTVRLYVDGAAVGEFMGAQPEQAIKEFLKQHLPADTGTAEPARSPDLQVLIEGFLRDEQIEQAEQALKQAAETEGDSPLMHDGLKARVKLARDAEQFPPIGQLEALVAKDSTDLGSLFKLSARQAAKGDYDTAMEGLLLVLSKERNFSDGAARESILTVFEALGAGDERVGRFRGLLANTLN
jgi:putative thioredoxin